MGARPRRCVADHAVEGVVQHRAPQERRPIPRRGTPHAVPRRVTSGDPRGAAPDTDSLMPVSTDGDQLRFLVVDDTEDIRDLMARMVVRLGHVADQAADGEEAVEALSRYAYDIMLLDLTMPRMSGEDVVRWLRDNPDRSEGLDVVVVSAWAGEQRAVLQELGVTTVLQKPLRGQQLRDLISDRNARTAP